jgi:hypothetical protein
MTRPLAQTLRDGQTLGQEPRNMGRRRKRGKRRWLVELLVAVLAGLVLALILAGPAPGQQFLHYGFEGRDPVWVVAKNDTTGLHEITHALVGIEQGIDGSVHSGQRSEFLHFQVEQGSVLHYTCAIGRAPVEEELTASLWLRSNQPGIQLLARVVLPRERDPQHPDQALTLLLPGDKYRTVSRWQSLALPFPVKLLGQQAQILRTTLGRDVVLTDAYIDQLVLNLYTGPGETKVWIDDLAVGPLLADPETRPGAPSAGPTPAQTAGRPRSAVQVAKQQLWIDGQRRFMIGIRHSGVPLPFLRSVGCNTVWLDESSPEGEIEEASRLGFLVVPSLRLDHVPTRPGGQVPGQLTSAGEVIGQKVARFIDQPDILGWELGANLSAEQAPEVMRTAQAFRNLDPARPVAVDVCDGFLSYSRSLQQPMIGIHRWPLLTTLELPAYRDWLLQRRLLADPNAYCWTWVQTHWPDWFTTMAYQRNAATRFDEPVGPHAEQIRLLSYIAVGCGFRGLAYWSDQFLDESHMGKDRWLSLAVLNQELQMLEPLLVSLKDEPVWIESDSSPFVKVAILRCDGGILALPVWMGPGAQIVPPQGALSSLKFTVPLAPTSSVAWEVSPGRIRSYPLTPRLGGMQVELHDFSLTAAVVLTSDLDPRGLIVRFQTMHRELHEQASQYLLDQAEEELKKALVIDEELRGLGHGLPDGDRIVEKAKDELKKGREFRRQRAFPEAYTSAQVVLRTVRVLMRGHWEGAMAGLNTPVITPYLLSYYTLPRHYRFVDEVLRLKAGKNVLPGGDFELPPQQDSPGWVVQVAQSLDAVETSVRRVAPEGLPKDGGKQCLLLEIAPRNKLLPPPQALERTFLALQSPSVRLPPGALVRIRVWVRIPTPILSSADGAIVYDSAGGEPMALRLREPTSSKGQMYSVFRRVPSSGEMHVTLGLSGLGRVYFDNVLIEPMEEKDSRSFPVDATAGTVAGGPGVSQR